MSDMHQSQEWYYISSMAYNLGFIGEIEQRAPDAGKLKGTIDYRLRVGTYRIVYDINDEEQTIAVYRIKHRREAYREKEIISWKRLQPHVHIAKSVGRYSGTMPHFVKMASSSPLARI